MIRGKIWKCNKSIGFSTGNLAQETEVHRVSKARSSSFVNIALLNFIYIAVAKETLLLYHFPSVCASQEG